MNIKWLVIALLLLGKIYDMALHFARYRSARNPAPANVVPEYSHPPLSSRISALEEAMQ